MMISDPRADGRILLTGRTGREEKPFPMHWTGSGAVLTGAFASLDVRLKADYGTQAPWIAVLADGVPVARFCAAGGEEWYHAILGMDPGTVRRISILRDSQPVPGDGGKLCLTGLRFEGTLERTQKETLHVGLIGDSLTVGEGCLGPVGAGEWITAWMSGALTWGAELRRRLSCRTRAMCLGGWGVYSSWDGQLSGAIPRIYSRVCAPEGAEEEFDFAADPLDAAVISLGTNDMSALRALPEGERSSFGRAVEEAAVSFIRTVHKKEPRAAILWAYGLCGDEGKELFERAAARAAAEGIRCGFVSLRPFGEDEAGSRGHPGPVVQAEAGRKTAEALRSLLERKDMP